LASRDDPPAYEAGWKDALPVGVRLGDSTAPNTIVVFSDLECPGCRQFHSTVQRLLRDRPKDVSVVFVHFPLGMHRFATQAAQAAECAQARGRFGQFVDAVYEQQDSIGIKGWGAFAAKAGISDTGSISECARNPKSTSRIEAGRALGLKWGIHATPTVLINGERYFTPPSEQEIDRALKLGPLDSAVAARATPSADRATPDLSATVGKVPSRPRVEIGDSDFVAHNVVRLYFAGIPLAPAKDSAAARIVRRAFAAQFADYSGSDAAVLAQKRGWNQWRDSALRVLLDTQAERAAFDRNVAKEEGPPARP
jgi:hypothetical protein